MKFILACLLLVSFSNATHFFVGETLDYQISWSALLAPRINAGNARLLVRKTSNENELEIVSRAWSEKVFFFHVNDTVRSTVSADSLLPRVFNQKISEGNYRRNAFTHYDFENKKAIIKDTAYSKEKRKHAIDTTIVLEGGERCILSAFYLTRTFKMKPGDTVYFNAISGKKTYKMKVICHRKETINTALGKKETLVVEPIIQGDGLFNAKGKLLIWLTDDEKRIPVLMESEIAIGSVRAALLKVTPM